MGTITISEIEQVTVYSRGARVRRVTTTGITGEVRITGLPLGLVDDTVRAEVLGAGVVTGVRVELDAAAVTERADDAFDREVRATRARLIAAEAEVARLGSALALLASLAPVARRARPDGAVVPTWSRSLDARLAVLDLRVGREAELRTALDAAQREVRDAKEAVAAAQDRAARASTGRGLRAHELCKVVVASVDGDTAARVAIEYLVGAARWAPTYSARLAGGKAELELRAVVAQNSGEDWRGARLTLSTAEPMRFAELPELAMARIGRRQPHVAKRGFRPPPTGADDLYLDYDRAFLGRPGRGGREHSESSGFEDITKEIAAPYANAVPAGEFDADETTGVDGRYDLGFDDDDDAVETGRRGEMNAMSAPRSRGAPPPPAAARPSAMAPMPPMEPMVAQSKTRGLVGVGAIAAAPLGAVVALGGLAKAAFGRKDHGAPGGGGGFGEDEAGDAFGGEVDLLGDDAAALLAYAELRMPAPGNPRRGRLVRVGVFAQYGEALAARGLAIASDTELARAIVAPTSSIEALALPPGTSGEWDHHYDHAFVGDAPVDVASDATWHAIAVTARTAPVVLRHVVVPREGTEVYRIAELANPLGGPMLPGPIDVFDDGVYLLTSHLEGVPAGAPVELGLGVDPKVKASRNTTYREESSGMLRGSLKLEHEVTVEIANHAQRAVDVEVRERLPVVPDGDDAIELAVVKTEPRWERWSPPPASPGATRLKGGHRWRITVPAGETRTLVAAYAIKIAAKHELVGGNRRES